MEVVVHQAQVEHLELMERQAVLARLEHQEELVLVV